MKTRTKKYLTSTKQGDNKKKGSATNAGYDEQNEITYKAPKKNPAVVESDDLKSKVVESKTKKDEAPGKTDSNTVAKNI